MRAGDLLRQLDQRLLPPLSRALAGLGQGASRRRLVPSAAVLSAAAVLLTAVWVVDRPPVGDRTVGEVTRVGVVDGDSIPGYLRTAGDELAAMPAAATPAPGVGTYALVSLSAYLPPQRLGAVLGDVGVSEVFARVPLPGRQTEIVRIPALRVPDDVVAGMAELAGRKERDAADYRARGAALTGTDETTRALRQVYDSGAEVAAAEAAAYRAGCSCVYAAVVRAEPAVLRTVAARPGVRVVDPAPEVNRLDRTVFTPPLPEQRDVVRPPADQGLERVPAGPTGPTGTSRPAASPTGSPAGEPVPVPVPTSAPASPSPTTATSTPPPGSPSPTPVGDTGSVTTP